ncbi:MAG: hypothetical protein PHS73_01625 [Candidatus Peribacteraceae bacterium]|nr:hypothetical protein [Candidatus Peribacteraceae bacterium]
MYYERNFPSIFMASQTPEKGSESRDLLPVSGTIKVAETGNVEGIRSELHGSFLDVSDARKGNSTGGAASTADVSRDNRDSLSDADRQALFNGLQTTLRKPENCEGVRDKWDVIEAALKKNPRMMLNLKRLQDMGAELVVSDSQEGQYVEFADAAAKLDIRKQEKALQDLTEAERNAVIEQILQTLDQGQRETARQWITAQSQRSSESKGLNWVEALVLSVAHGGTPISYETYEAMTRKASVLELTTWTWCLQKLSDVMTSGFAPYCSRDFGSVRLTGDSADRRRGDRGGRVAGLRVPIA